MNIEFSECIVHIIKFHNLSLTYNRLLNKVSESDLCKSIVEHTHEAMLIKQITEWELFCVSIISFAISRDTARLSKYLNINLPKRISVDNAQAIINGLNIFSIQSASELKRLSAKIITPRYNPFQQFLKPMLIHIDEAILIRNFIAHKSRASKNKLMAHYRRHCKLKEFVGPGDYLSRTKDTFIGPFVCSQLYAWIFMQMAILSWRLLDRASYDVVFVDERTSEGTMLGMVRMNLLFEEMGKKFNINGN